MSVRYGNQWGMGTRKESKRLVEWWAKTFGISIREVLGRHTIKWGGRTAPR